MQKYVNNYETTLHAAINSTQTTIQVPVSTKFDDLAALTPPDYYLLTISDATNIEIVKVTSVGAGPIRTLTVQRDVSNTAHGAFSFAAGASVKMNVTAESMNDLSQIASNAAYPPNLTVNTQTFLNPGDYPGSPSTLNIPFSPLIVQQINVETSTPALTVNITAASSPQWGESVINLYRANATYNWPTFTVNGNPVNFMGQPPESGVYFAQVVCRKTPGTGYLGGYTVSLEWVTKAIASSSGDTSYPPNFTVQQHTRSADGDTLNINFSPLTINRLNRVGAGSVYINVLPTAEYGESTIIIYRSDASYPWPVLSYNGEFVPVNGQPPAAPNKLAKLVCRRVPTGGGFPVQDDFVTFEWITISDEVAMPSADGTVTQLGVIADNATVDITLLTATAAFRASLGKNVIINFVSTGFTTAMTKTIRLAFMLAFDANPPTIKYNNFAVTVSGTVPAMGSICILEGVFIEGDGNFQSIKWLPYSSVD